MSYHHAHPAFPPLSSTSSTHPLPAIPTCSAQLINLIRSCATLQSIRECLIPILQQIAEGRNQDGPSGSNVKAKDSIARGEEVLLLAEVNFYEWSDEQVKGMTAALVYAVSAFARNNQL